MARGKGSDYNDDFKRKAVEAYLAGESAVSIADRMGCSRSAIENWSRLLKWSKPGNGPKVGFGDPPPPASLPEEDHWPEVPPALPPVDPTPVDNIISVMSTLKADIKRVEERITTLSAEMEGIEKLLPKMKAALAALEGA